MCDEDKEFEIFKCRPVIHGTCFNKFYRDNIGDLFDYPYCEECQELQGEIMRLDNGQHI